MVNKHKHNKVEVDLKDLEEFLELADDYVYWQPWSIELAERLEEACKKARETI